MLSRSILLLQFFLNPCSKNKEMKNMKDKKHYKRKTISIHQDNEKKESTDHSSRRVV